MSPYTSGNTIIIDGHGGITIYLGSEPLKRIPVVETSILIHEGINRLDAYNENPNIGKDPSGNNHPAGLRVNDTGKIQAAISEIDATNAQIAYLERALADPCRYHLSESDIAQVEGYKMSVQNTNSRIMRRLSSLIRKSFIIAGLMTCFMRCAADMPVAPYTHSSSSDSGLFVAVIVPNVQATLINEAQIKVYEVLKESGFSEIQALKTVYSDEHLISNDGMDVVQLVPEYAGSKFMGSEPGVIFFHNGVRVRTYSILDLAPDMKNSEGIGLHSWIKRDSAKGGKIQWDKFIL